MMQTSIDSKRKAPPKESTSKSNRNENTAPTQVAEEAKRVGPKKRPRERSPFWSIPPVQTPPAVPFPKGALKHARAVLPAAKARSDFLQALKKADHGSHVVLCTGETGCGKSTVSFRDGAMLC